MNLLTDQLTLEQGPSWETCTNSASEEIPRRFMKAEGPLSYSLEPVIGPCLEPDNSSLIGCTEKFLD
jgi:hypothetical protein